MSGTDPESEALIWQLHRELNGLTRSSRRGNTQLVSLDLPKREPVLGVKPKGSRRAEPESSTATDLADTATKKQHKATTSGSALEQAAGTNAQSGKPTSTKVGPTSTIDKKDSSAPSTKRKTASATNSEQNNSKPPVSSSLPATEASKAKPPAKRQRQQEETTHKTSNADNAPKTTKPEHTSKPVKTETASKPAKAENAQNPRRTESAPHRSKAAEDIKPAAAELTQAPTTEPASAAVACPSNPLPPPEQQPTSIPPLPPTLTRPLVIPPLPTMAVASSGLLGHPVAQRSPLASAAATAAADVKAKAVRQTSGTSGPRLIKCFYAGVRWGISLAPEAVATRADLAAALNEAFAGEILSCGRGEHLSIIFVDANGATTEFPSLRQTKGQDSMEIWHAVVGNAVKVYVRRSN